MNIINLVNGSNAYFKEEGYCEWEFIMRYNEEPLETSINWYGDCIYKLHKLQENYFTLSDLKQNH